MSRGFLHAQSSFARKATSAESKQNSASFQSVSQSFVQGDTSGSAKSPVDFIPKVPFWPGLARPKRNFCFEVNGRFAQPDVSLCMHGRKSRKTEENFFRNGKNTAILPSSVTSNQLVRSYKNSFAFNYPLEWLMVRVEELVSKLRPFLMVNCCCYINLCWDYQVMGIGRHLIFT